jgi:hypothetical protein
MMGRAGFEPATLGLKVLPLKVHLAASNGKALQIYRNVVAASRARSQPAETSLYAHPYARSWADFTVTGRPTAEAAPQRFTLSIYPSNVFNEGRRSQGPVFGGSVGNSHAQEVHPARLVTPLGGVLASVYCLLATNTRKSSSLVASLSLWSPWTMTSRTRLARASGAAVHATNS